jgi:glutamate/tyrosine decarboxylase-like PLP-dependent enzyme
MDDKRRNSPLEMTPEEFRVLGYQLVDRIAQHFEELASGPVTPGEPPNVVRDLLTAEAPLPLQGVDAGPLLAETADLLFKHSLFNGHPKFNAYITSSAAPIGILADLLASTVNPNCGASVLAPMATEIEKQTIRWIAEFIGYPVDCGGLLVSGGNMANYVGFFAARAAMAGFDIRKSGVGTSKLRCYASAETHTWIQKAADLAGLGTDSIRWIAADRNQRLDLTALRAQVARDREAGDQPFLVIGTAGTVSTGAVDSLAEISAFCNEQALWFHVDGAYGGLAARIPSVAAEFAGICDADSVAVDPHKWLYAPLEAGCALVRTPQLLLDAFSYHPPYYNFDTSITNYFDYGFQNSRGFRALKVWLAFKHAGSDGYTRMIGDDIALARRLFEIMDAHPKFEALTNHLSITTFRYVGEMTGEARLNSFNQVLLRRLEKSGEAFVSNAIVDGKFALRLCTVNFRTSARDMAELPSILCRLASEISPTDCDTI